MPPSYRYDSCPVSMAQVSGIVLSYFFIRIGDGPAVDVVVAVFVLRSLALPLHVGPFLLALLMNTENTTLLIKSFSKSKGPTE